MAAIDIGSNPSEAVTFTQSAANKVAELIREEENPELKLRVFITGGGCSGFQYGFTFDETVNDDDTVLEKKAEPVDEAKDFIVKLLIDAVSYQYLSSATIDYREDLQGAQFVIQNPHAKTTCGCGASFSI